MQPTLVHAQPFHQEERVTWWRVPALPGIEMLYLENTDRHWKVLNSAYGVGASTSWHGEVFYGRRLHSLTPGGSLCITPGEIHTTPTTRHRGNFSSICFDPAVFDAYLAEHEIAPGRGAWASAVTMLSPRLLRCHGDLLRLVRCDHTVMEVQSGVIGLLELAVGELLEKRPRLPALGRTAAERIRDCLHSDEGTAASLDELAATVGMSRFDVVRTFRARYGVAPHAYQICRKVARARILLRDGNSLTEAATTCGFADQSHFGRHFKKHVGVTPGEYVRSTWTPRPERTG